MSSTSDDRPRGTAMPEIVPMSDTVGAVDLDSPDHSDLLPEREASPTDDLADDPLGVVETRATLRAGLADRVKAATDHELKIQNQLKETADFKEGIAATSERRLPNFQGR